MAEFFARIFRSRSFSRSSSFQNSDPSLQQSSFQSTRTNSSFSLSNLAGYTIQTRELETHKLHQAAWEGKLKKVQKLSSVGQINIRDRSSRTPLHLAVVKGHIDIVDYLVSQGALLSLQDEDGRTPLVKAVLSGGKNPQKNLQICQILLEPPAADHINIPDRTGRTALHYAVEYGNDDLCHLLLSSGFCDLNLQDRDFMGPLHLATKKRRAHVVEMIIDEQHSPQVDINLCNRQGQTALHIAAAAGFDEIVRLLLLSKLTTACDTTITDANNQTASDLATTNLHRTSVKLIQEFEEKFSRNSTQHRESSIRQDPMTNPVSLVPASNIETSEDETSDEASAIPTNRSLKAPARQGKRPSDQWSDDISAGRISTRNLPNIVKSLIETNPIQPATNISPSSESSAAEPPKKNPEKSNFAFGPVVERADSDETSTIKSIVIQHKPAHNLVSKSWSEKSSPSKHKSKDDDEWDSTTAEDSDEEIKTPKNDQLNKSTIFSGSHDEDSSTESDANSIKTEIQNNKLQNIPNLQKKTSDDSSWTSPVESVATNFVQKPIVSPRKSPLDHSRPLSGDLKQENNDVRSETSSTWTKTDSVLVEKEKDKNQSPTKLLISSFIRPVETMPNHVEEDEQSSSESNKTLEQDTSRVTVRNSQPLNRLLSYEKISQRGSGASNSSSNHSAALNELRESIKKLQENQDDTRELKQKLLKMEDEKNELERLYRQVQNKLADETREKQQLESTKNSLSSELDRVREKFERLDREKQNLNERFIALNDEQRRNKEKIEQAERKSFSIEGLTEEDLRKVFLLHQKKLRELSTDKENLEDRSKKLQVDLEVNRESIDSTLRYKQELEKAIEEKHRFQQENDRLKLEKDIIHQEKIQYKTKYDCLQEEIRSILLDRSKIEQKLTEELQQQMQQRQQSKEDLFRYKNQIEQMNLKLLDAEARLSLLKSESENLLKTKESTFNNKTRDFIFSQKNPTVELVQTRLSFPPQTSDSTDRNFNEQNSLIATSEKIRSEASRAMNELDRLRENFDRLVSAYDPNENLAQQARLHAHIDIFRQFNENEFRLKQNSSFRTSFSPDNDRFQATRRSPTTLPRRASELLMVTPFT